MKECEHFSAIMKTAPSGKKILDFGQNFAGYLSFDLEAKAGEKIVLRFGELLDEQGELTQKNIQCSTKKKTTPLQQVIYTCKEGRNAYKTKFAIFGFQYVEVDTNIEIKPENFVGIAVYSAFEQTGIFTSSHPFLNQLVDATLWSTKSNSGDIPTDCPTRERHGWTGDAQIFFQTASYFVDYASFSKKYLRDVYDWQLKSGRLPQIAPAGGVDFYMWVMNGSVGWADFGVIMPYQFWKLFGDRTILEEYYDRMKAYAHFMQGRCGQWGGPFAKPLHLKGEAKRYAVNRGQSYGEWAEPAEVCQFQWYDFVAPHPEVSTAYTAYVMRLMEEIATELGRTEDLEAAYRLLENEEIPGWLSMPKAGATTIWEAWEGPNSKEGGIGSLNHYSKGAVCQWLFETMCGIHVAGENEFFIAPKPGGSFAHAKAEYNSVYGKVVSGWVKAEDGTYQFEVEVPANTTAKVNLPDGRKMFCEAGTYQF